MHILHTSVQCNVLPLTAQNINITGTRIKPIYTKQDTLHIYLNGSTFSFSFFFFWGGKLYFQFFAKTHFLNKCHTEFSFQIGLLEKCLRHLVLIQVSHIHIFILFKSWHVGIYFVCVYCCLPFNPEYGRHWRFFKYRNLRFF